MDIPHPGVAQPKVCCCSDGLACFCSTPTAAEEKDKYAFPDHGHRMAYLLKPLPPTEDEEA